MPASNDVVWIDVLPSMARWTPTLTKQLGPESEKAGESVGKRMSSGMSKALAGGVVGIGAVLTKGLLDNINISKANDLLAAQMGTTVKASARIGKLAGSLYRDAYGESLEEVQSALRGVQSNIGDLSKFSNREIESMGAKALDLATIMGEDVSGVTRGVGQLIRNGLAKDATEGFDIITRAAQSVPETMQGELLETIEEYGADFAQLGLTGQQAMGAISAAVKAGARNTDLAADAFREFSIRAIDGSKSTAAGYEALGLDAEDMAKKIAAGGPAATEATSTIIRRLKGMSDPVKQEAAGVQLFGTRYEELGVKAIGAMDPMKSGLKGVKGAAKDAGNTLNDNFGTRFEGWKRTAQGFVQDGLMAMVRGFDQGKASGSGLTYAVSAMGAIVANQILPALTNLADAGRAGFAWARTNQTTVKVLAGVLGGLTAGMVIYSTTAKVVTGVTKAWTIATGLLNGTIRANPLGIFVTALAALAAGLVFAYKKSETFRTVVDATWAVIKRAISSAWNGVIKPILSAWVDYLQNVVFPVVKFLYTRVVKPYFESMGRTIASVWRNGVRPTFGALADGVGRIKDAFSTAVDAIGRIWGGLKSAAMAPVKFVVETIYNKGIVPMLDKIPGVTAPRKVYIGGGSSYSNAGGTYQDPGQRTLYRATGGPVPHWGAAGKDSVRAMLMPDEHVWTTKEVRGAGGHAAVRRIRELAAKGHLGGMGTFGRQGDLGWDTAPGFAKGGGFTDAQIAKAQDFAKSQAGKPYIWGGVGPAGYDCSGFMSAIVNVLRGFSPYSRVGTSSTFPWPGFQPGPGQFTVGAFTGSPGHVAGTLGGMNVESTNGSVRVGPAARGATNPMFTRMAHLGAGGNYGGGPGGMGGPTPKESALAKFGDALSAIKSFASQIGGWISGLINLGGWGGLIKDMTRSVVGGVGKWIDDKIPNKFLPDNPLAKAGVYDNGGWLMPGQVAVNRSRTPEPVFSGAQWQTLNSLVRPHVTGADHRMRPSQPIVLTGTLETPWGPAQVRGIAREEARRVVGNEGRANALARGPV